jgi:hypothetical protein
MTIPAGPHCAAPPKPIELMTERELLTLARLAMASAARQPRGSLSWTIQWAVYDTYAFELGRRACALLVAGRHGQ